MGRGRPRKSSSQLRLTNTPSHKVRRREIEEKAEREATTRSLADRLDAGEIPEDRQDVYRRFLASVGRERDSFQRRVLTDSPIALERGAFFHETGPVPFKWGYGHYLDWLKKCATVFASRKSMPTWAHAAEASLNDLKLNDHPFVFDPDAVGQIDAAYGGNLALWVFTFADDPEEKLNAFEMFELVNFLGWKKRDGSPRFDAWWYRDSPKVAAIISRGRRALNIR